MIDSLFQMGPPNVQPPRPTPGRSPSRNGPRFFSNRSNLHGRRARRVSKKTFIDIFFVYSFTCTGLHVRRSLATSVFDPEVYLVGASGGVYALLASHLSNVLLNYNNMEFGILRLLGVLLIASVDVGFAIYDRYSGGGAHAPVSYVAHLAGAAAGLTLGLVVLKNFEQRLREQWVWWGALSVYAACMIFAVLFNLVRDGSGGGIEGVETGNSF